MSQKLLNNTSEQMEEIMNTNKLMKEEEFEQVLQRKKQLISELDTIEIKYNVLSREYASQSQEISLTNQLENARLRKNLLGAQINNNLQLSLTDKSIGIERESNLHHTMKLLQPNNNNKPNDKERINGINELYDLYMKQTKQMGLLQNNEQIITKILEHTASHPHMYQTIGLILKLKLPNDTNYIPSYNYLLETSLWNDNILANSADYLIYLRTNDCGLTKILEIRCDLLNKSTNDSHALNTLCTIAQDITINNISPLIVCILFKRIQLFKTLHAFFNLYAFVHLWIHYIENRNIHMDHFRQNIDLFTVLRVLL